MKLLKRAAGLALSCAFIGGAYASGLPNQVVWTSYPSGSAGNSQAIAIGAALRNADGTNMRVLPGRNEIARFTPLKRGQAHFASTGTDYAFAQEGIFSFAHPDWGPQAVRLVATGIPSGAIATMAVAADAGVKELKDLKGKRVAWIVGSPALNLAAESQLAFAGLTWDDVQKVEVSSYPASIEAIVADRADAAQSLTFSTALEPLAASPRGLYHPPMPREDKEGWARLQAVMPWYFPHVATVGPGVPKEGLEAANGVYPALVTYPDRDASLVEGMLEALYRNFDAFKRAAPDGESWALDRQIPAQMYVPYHEGAVAYLKSVGRWGDAEEQRQRENLERQEVLLKAWDDFTKGAPSGEQFAAAWMQHRAKALAAAGLPAFLE